MDVRRCTAVRKRGGEARFPALIRRWTSRDGSDAEEGDGECQRTGDGGDSDGGN